MSDKRDWKAWGPAVERMMTAHGIGPTSLLRLRAEVLLKHGDKGEMALSEDERATLERITVAPRLDDEGFLGGFDARLEALDDE